MLVLCRNLGLNPLTLFREEGVLTHYIDEVHDLMMMMEEEQQKTILQMTQWGLQGTRQRTGHEQAHTAEIGGDRGNK